MRFFLRLLGLGILLLLLVLVANTLRLPSHQLGAVPAAPAVTVADSALARLAGAVRIPTVSTTDFAQTDTAQFGRFGRYLRQAFPKVLPNSSSKNSTSTACSSPGLAPTRP